MDKVLITGGAGFIGSNLIKNLTDHDVTVMDNLLWQVHQDKVPDFPVVKENICNQEAFFKLLDDKDIVIHLAAETGTGQSMEEISKYTFTNIYGTSLLCEYLLKEKHDIKKVILASSRAIYGEGKYFCNYCGIMRKTP